MCPEDSICHIHAGSEWNLIFYHTNDGLIESAEGPYSGNGSEKVRSDLLGLKEMGYKFIVGPGGDHKPVKVCPDKWCREEIARLNLPGKLPD